MIEEIITTHQYIDKYPISEGSTKLILGTIHPHDHEKFQIPFFYGNKMTFWNIMKEAYPEKLKTPLNVNQIVQFLQENNISVSDTIKTCKRTKKSALDKHLIPIEFNKKLIEQIEKSNIKEIYFTSGFNKNNAFKTFYENILGLKIDANIKKERELVLEKGIFNRNIKLIILYSPSGSANLGISNSLIYLKNKHKYQNFEKPIKQFRIDLYRQQFDLK